jgi:methionyl-tRNA formyltransferase
MSYRPFVLAAQHPRYDALRDRLDARFPGRVVHIRSPAELTVEALAAVDSEYVFFPHWSHIIPARIHQAFPCVIFHMTDVPFGRGGSPLQNLISRGIYETRMTALRCVSQLDAGPVYLKRPLSLEGTAEQIYARAGELIGEMIETIVTIRPEPVAQEGEPVVFARRTPEQSDISGLGSLRGLYDQIRMLDADGYPHASARVGRFRITFTRASLSDGKIVAQVQITEDRDDA